MIVFHKLKISQLEARTNREVVAELGQMIIAVLLRYTLDLLVVMLECLVAPPLANVSILVVSPTWSFNFAR